jgi:hypothetical protein
MERVPVDRIAAALADIEVPVGPSNNPPATPPADPPAGDPPPGDPPAPPAEGGGDPQPPAFENPYLKTMRDRFKLSGIELDIPKELEAEGVAPEKVIDYMQTKILEHGSSSDPFLSKYLEASKQEGFDRDKFISSYNEENALLTMPSKDFLRTLYKKRNGKTEANPEGWTDADIDTRLSKMDRIELDEVAESLKTKMKENLTKSTTSPEVIQKRIQIANDAIFKNVEDVAVIMSKESNIGGIPHTQEDAAEFKEVFKQLAAINPETGKPRFTDFFSDDKNLYSSLYLMWKATNEKNGINSWLSDFKENFKAEILSKTKVNPSTQRGNSKQISQPKPEDYV